ncbi:MAG: DUF2461 family protein [Thermoguttaceae bacterium]|nr:DUF2461 family protein [Thermoguttaceae bacterium]
MESGGFSPTLFEFLEQLADHNNRPWFQENKRRYELLVLEPAMAFIRDFRPRLKKISPYFVASDQRVGGSLMRVYRAFLDHVAASFAATRPFMRLLCDALNAPF